MRIEPFELRGRFVHLTPMTVDDVHGLLAAATEDRTTYGYTTVPGDHDTMTAARGRPGRAPRRAARTCRSPRVTRRDGRIVGSTRFLWLRSYFDRDALDAVEIGGTWLAASAQRRPINTEAKLLMLGHAFDAWRRAARRPQDRRRGTRAAAPRSNASVPGSTAWSATGSRRSSRVRRAVPATARCTRSCRAEWPAVRAALEARLTR